MTAKQISAYGMILCILGLSGCYPANGSPPSNHYWLKNGERLSYADAQACGAKTDEHFQKADANAYARYVYLKEKFDKDYTALRNTPAEYQEFMAYLDQRSPLQKQCYYGLGYRFKPTLYWCLAQDGADNSKTCIENRKYRK